MVDRKRWDVSFQDRQQGHLSRSGMLPATFLWPYLAYHLQQLRRCTGLP